MTQNKTDGLLDSLMDAVKPGNLLSRFLQFIIFGVITATPYLVKNLDEVTAKVQEAGVSGFWVILYFLKSMMAAMWKGVFIGLSTLFSTIINLSSYISDHKYGTLAYSLLIMIFATLTFYQPIRLIFNVIDMKKGREHSKFIIVMVAIVFVIIIASPVAYLINQGETITSGMQEDTEEDSGEITEPPANSTQEVNNTIIENNNESIVNSLNLLGG